MALKEILDQIKIPPLNKCGILLDKMSRLKTYFHLLEIADRCSSADESLKLINSKLDDVEDCHSGQKKLKNPGLNYNGRMYPVFEDYIQKESGGKIIARTKGNRIVINKDGSFIISEVLTGEVILSK
ncbi:hypothetical protein [Flavobacterium sp. ZB4P13]|uniref:hypothetical protein n=1 Tax=Flavobacterium sp. ZB4P13 TaxID=3401728 RepID=UPI003AB012B5